DAVGAPFDVDVDRPLLVGGQEEALQPAALAGHGARRLLQPLARVGAERRLEGVVAPFDAAALGDDGDRCLDSLGDRVVAHCGTLMARSCCSLARWNSVLNGSKGERISSFCRSRRPSINETRKPSCALRLKRSKFVRNSALSRGTACKPLGLPMSS